MSPRLLSSPECKNSTNILFIVGPVVVCLSRSDTSRRYITKNLQKEFGFHGMQIRLTLKKSVNVYDPEGRGGSGKGRAKRKFGKKGRLLPQPPSPTRYRPGSHK